MNLAARHEENATRLSHALSGFCQISKAAVRHRGRNMNVSEGTQMA